MMAQRPPRHSVYCDTPTTPQVPVLPSDLDLAREEAKRVKMFAIKEDSGGKPPR